MPSMIYVPLDERPCNRLYPQMLADMTDIRMLVPPLSLLGDKKKPSDFTALQQWLLERAGESERLILSLDQLLYGGIVPSRLHRLSVEECERRLNVLRVLKQNHPELSISAFSLIMRTPAYDSSEEEPDYYAEYGRALFQYGELSDKRERNMITDEEMQRYQELSSAIPAEVLRDFLDRRAVNGCMNRRAVELTQEGIIDFLIIPLDDNAPFGFTAMEQRRLLQLIESGNLWDRVHMYPGADEIGCTLFARAVCESRSYRPDVFVRYSSTLGPTIIPKYEDRTLGESIKAHLTAAGARLADHSAEADVVLMVNAPAAGGYLQAETSDAFSGRHHSYFSEINYREFAAAIQKYADLGKFVALADVAVCNGADHALMKLLAKSGLLTRISAYAGWNTSGNTLGTVISHALIASCYRSQGDAQAKEKAAAASRRFLFYRLMEDWGYQSSVRKSVCAEDLPRLGGSYFNLEGIQQEVEAIIERKLREFRQEYLSGWPDDSLELANVHLPWRRMFEIGFEVK